LQHAAEHELPNGMRMIDSYHCSRYNTQTRRLTPEMFRRSSLAPPHSPAAAIRIRQWRTPTSISHLPRGLPAKPGVYRMLDADGNALYVGKAHHLKNRVRAISTVAHTRAKPWSCWG
jgi:hypothetical protein